MATISNFGASTMAASPDPIAVIGYRDEDIYLVLNLHENGQAVKLTFEPESTISNLETVRVNMLMMMLAGAAITAESTMKYIRAKNLERHFRFSAP
jgi:hypothetical protein